MKKRILLTLMSTMLLTGCGTKVINDHGDEVYKYGRFIEIADSKEEYKDEGGNLYSQVLVYDKDTKVIYILDKGYYKYGISPYYCIDYEGNPVVAIYNAEED